MHPLQKIIYYIKNKIKQIAQLKINKLVNQDLYKKMKYTRKARMNNKMHNKCSI